MPLNSHSTTRSRTADINDGDEDDDADVVDRAVRFLWYF